RAPPRTRQLEGYAPLRREDGRGQEEDQEQERHVRRGDERNLGVRVPPFEDLHRGIGALGGFSVDRNVSHWREYVARASMSSAPDSSMSITNLSMRETK